MSSGEGFSGSFISRMAWLFHESTRHLLGSEGWRKFDEGVGITHAEIEDRVNMDDLAEVFEKWLDDQLNEVDKSHPTLGQEFHSAAQCPLRVRVDELSDEDEVVFHHGECAMPKCTCTHYGDYRDHWAPCPYQGQQIPRDEVSTHSTNTKDEA